jgi:hypothetical protein
MFAQWNSSRLFAFSRVAMAASGMLAMLTLASSARAQDYMIRATGVWQCSSQGKVVPLAGARVALINADIDIETAGTNWDDHQMNGAQAAGFTDGNGFYTLTGFGSHGKPFGEKPNVYVIVGLSDENGVRLANQVNQEFSVSTRQDIHKQVGEKGQTVNVEIGTWTLGKGGVVAPPGQLAPDNANPSECELWSRARRAVLDYKGLTGGPPPAGRYGIEYYWAGWPTTPWTDIETTHWGPPSSEVPIIVHEFGHSVRQAIDGNRAHFDFDASTYLYPQFHAFCHHPNGVFPSQFAFNEGWAEYWEEQTGQTCPNPADMEYEGNVAHALETLSECAGRGPAGRLKMLGVLQSAPGQIHTFQEFVQHAPWASACLRGLSGQSTGTTSNPLAQQEW